MILMLKPTFLHVGGFYLTANYGMVQMVPRPEGLQSVYTLAGISTNQQHPSVHGNYAPFPAIGEGPQTPRLIGTVDEDNLALILPVASTVALVSEVPDFHGNYKELRIVASDLSTDGRVRYRLSDDMIYNRGRFFLIKSPASGFRFRWS